MPANLLSVAAVLTDFVRKHDTPYHAGATIGNLPKITEDRTVKEIFELHFFSIQSLNFPVGYLSLRKKPV